MVLDPHPKARYKRFSEGVLARLQALTEGSPEEVFFQALLVSGVITYSQAVQASNLERDAADQAAQALLDSGQLVALGSDPTQLTDKILVASTPFWTQLRQNCLKILKEYHHTYPLRPGIPLEELKSRLGVDQRVFSALTTRLDEEEQLVQLGAIARLPEHDLKFTPLQQEQIDALMAKFTANPFTPPTIKECVAEIGEDLYQALVAQERLLPVSSEVVFQPEDYRQAVADIQNLVGEQGSVTLAQARDHWGTTRRYVQALLEYMDQQGVTIRDGDARKLRRVG
jgi:selenocysteine-specific elongation factor